MLFLSITLPKGSPLKKRRQQVMFKPTLGVYIQVYWCSPRHETSGGKCSQATCSRIEISHTCQQKATTPVVFWSLILNGHTLLLFCTLSIPFGVWGEPETGATFKVDQCVGGLHGNDRHFRFPFKGKWRRNPGTWGEQLVTG